MKFRYGKMDWLTLERGQENCYLLTNGLGGFSSSTIVNSNTRNDHAFFMGSKKAPNERINLIHKLEEWITIDGINYPVSTQQYLDKIQDSHKYLAEFSFEDYPEWIYLYEGVELVKSIAMKQGENTIAVCYEVINETEKTVTVVVTPWMEFVPKGDFLESTQSFERKGNVICSDGLCLYEATNGLVQESELEYRDDFYYSYDECDGRKEIGAAVKNHTIIFDTDPKQTKKWEIIYSMSPIQEDAASIFEQSVQYREQLVKVSGIQSDVGQMLVKSANQFISERESTGGKTILAGYPFFEDWGRDTMIAMAGCCITTKQFETAKDIFRTFMQYCQDGLMPNLFPEGGKKPMYNTVDAALLFINTVYLYYKETADLDFVKEAWEVMKQIIHSYKNGTKFGIHADKDGLIMAGEGLDQVTWMDVRVGEILPTPRHGKPVEINAYWYSALKIMQEFADQFLDQAMPYGQMAAQVKESFCSQFWNETSHCLKDVISGTDADEQIRCNQIWAVSMPYTMLSEEEERQVVETVFEKLYTPYGLRTLNKEDKQFHAAYGGEQLKRDLAYHQGTVWAFPLGAYYLSYLKVHHYSEEAKNTVKRRLSMLENAMREGCVGQLPEIYDGENPTRSQGCFAQAWSVGELLRVYAELERN